MFGPSESGRQRPGSDGWYPIYTEALETARHPRRLPVRLHLHDLPQVRRGQESVDGNGAPHVAQVHVEGVTPAVGVEGLLVEPVGPRPEEGNAAQSRRGLEGVNRFVRPSQDVLALHLHLEGDVANRRRDGHDRLARHVLESHDVAGAAGRVGLGCAGRPDRNEPRERENPHASYFQSLSQRMFSQVMLPCTPLTPCGTVAGMNSTSPALIVCDCPPTIFPF